MQFSMKFSLSLLLLLCCVVYQSYASIGVDAAPINDTEDDCMCGRIYEPVCASDSKTYNNPCLFECARKQLLARGRSLVLMRQGSCVDEVQGRRHKMAEERTVLRAADKDKDMESCACDRSFIPVCGSDNRTYGNHCLFNCRRSILARFGKILTLLRQGACNLAGERW